MPTPEESIVQLEQIADNMQAFGPNEYGSQLEEIAGDLRKSIGLSATSHDAGGDFDATCPECEGTGCLDEDGNSCTSNNDSAEECHICEGRGEV